MRTQVQTNVQKLLTSETPISPHFYQSDCLIQFSNISRSYHHILQEKAMKSVGKKMKKKGSIYEYRRTGEDTYWMYSTLIFADGECDTAEKASPDKRIVEGHGDFLQKSTTLTSIV